MKDSIRELESLLSDPQFKQSIQDLASGMINLEPRLPPALLRRWSPPDFSAKNWPAFVSGSPPMTLRR